MSFHYKSVHFLILVVLINSVFSSIYGASMPDTVKLSDSLTVPDSTVIEDPDSSKSKKNELTDTVFYESALISYDNEAKILYLTGNSRIKYQRMRLIADTIVYTINDDLFTASGSPLLIDGNDTTVGDYMVYNIKTRRGRVRYASTRLTDGSFNGSNIIKTEDNILYVNQGDYTTCTEIDTPHYYFYGKSIKVIPNDKIISKPVVMNIGNAPVAVLPFFIFPLDRNRRSGFLTPVWGGHPTNGGYVENIGYYWAPNDYIDLIARGKVNDFQRFELGAASSYNLKYKFSGHLSGRYTFDNTFQSGNQDWALDYSHDQTLTPDGLTRLSGNGSLTSSKDFYVKNSNNNDELTRQNISANMSLSKTFENINASSSVTWRRNHNLNTGVIDEDLPSFSFNLPSRPIIKAPDSLTGDKVPWYSKFYYDYSSFGIVKHIDSTKNNGRELFRPGANHFLNLSSPQKLFGHISVTPLLRTSQYFVYNYSDSGTSGFDTLIDSVTYVRYPPFENDNMDFETNNMYPVYDTVTIYDTLSRDPYGKPDSIRVTKKRKQIIALHKSYEKLAHIEDWNASLTLETRLYGIFPVKIVNLMGIRHTFTPSLSYTFNPEHKNDKLYQNSGVSPPGPRKQAQILGLGIGNLFEGKIGTKDTSDQVSERTVQFLSLNLNTGYDFEKKSRQWSDLSLNAASSIDKLGLSLSYTASFWLYDQADNLSVPIMNSMTLNVQSRTLGGKGTLWNGDLLDLDSLVLPGQQPQSQESKKSLDWSASLNPSFSFSMSRSRPGDMFLPKKTFNLSGSASLNFTKSWSIRWGGNYNFEKDQWVNNSFDLSCDLECWEMKFNWRPEKLNPGYYFLINIKKIPEIKWEQRN